MNTYQQDEFTYCNEERAQEVIDEAEEEWLRGSSLVIYDH